MNTNTNANTDNTATLETRFNRILKRFGANRIEVNELSNLYVDFSIAGSGRFVVYGNRVSQIIEENHYDTPTSEWLTAISVGAIRDDEGRMSTSPRPTSPTMLKRDDRRTGSAEQTKNFDNDFREVLENLLKQFEKLQNAVDEVNEILYPEDVDPRSMGWVGYDGLP